MGPEVILLDEPTASLDPKARRNLIETLRVLDRAMIIATHDIEMACSLCGIAVLLSDGCVAGEGDSRDLLRDEKFLNDHGL
jgi:cobalt/nickel transport system ATP-binding protein